MHGKEVPDDLPRYTLPFDHSLAAVRVSVLTKELTKDGIMLSERSYIYLKIPYWSFNRPLRFYFGQVGLDEDELIECARQLFRDA